MKAGDRWLQAWRIRVAAPFVRPGDRLLDVGCADGALLERLAGRVSFGVGLDPDARPRRSDRIEIRRGTFPGAEPLPAQGFDCVTLLAVLEHVPDPAALARECFRVLAPGGRAVLTVPHPAVDTILEWLIALRILDGMETEAHHGFDPRRTVPLFAAAGFRTLAERRFQLGLNRLFVFEKP